MHPGNDPHQTALHAAGLNHGFEPVDVVEVVNDNGADAGAYGELDLLGGLGVAVQDQRRRIGACGQRRDDLAAACHIEP